MPVLSSATVRTRARVSSTPPDLTTTPLLAARPIPARNATGAAISSGQGVATTSTCANLAGSPDHHQPAAASVNENSVNGSAYLSANRTIGDRLSAASCTRATILAYMLSLAGEDARTSETVS